MNNEILSNFRQLIVIHKVKKKIRGRMRDWLHVPFPACPSGALPHWGN